MKKSVVLLLYTICRIVLLGMHHATCIRFLAARTTTTHPLLRRSLADVSSDVVSNKSNSDSSSSSTTLRHLQQQKIGKNNSTLSRGPKQTASGKRCRSGKLATICKHANFGGPCMDLCDSHYCLACLPHERWLDGTKLYRNIRSFILYNNQEASLCSQAYNNGSCRNFFRNQGAYDLPLMDVAVGSIEIRPASELWRTVYRSSTYPNYDDTDWSEDAQGITHSRNHWYVSRAKGLYKYHVDSDLKTGRPSRKIGLPLDCKHYGDIQYYLNELFVPVEKCNKRYSTGVYVFDSLLQYKRHAYFAEGHSAPWIGINPLNGFFYVSSFTSSEIAVYKRNFEVGEVIRPISKVTLDREVRRIQGGVFSNSGHLYLTSDDRKWMGKPGVHVFKVRGNAAVHLRYFNTGHRNLLSYNEIEGIDLWDLDSDGRAPNIDGQIHVLQLDNDPGRHDDIWLRHFRVDAPSLL